MRNAGLWALTYAETMVPALVFGGSSALVVVSALLVWLVSPWWLILTAVALVILGIAVYDVAQRHAAVLHNFPALGHMRYLMETIRPMIQQYFVERNWDGRPFDADARNAIYERAAGISSVKSFGTELQVRGAGYKYLRHSIVPGVLPAGEHRVTIGGPQCGRPFSASLLNISSMSFGALSINAIMAMNNGAKRGGFFQETGEGGLTKYHLESGADLVWEIGSGYFGCRDAAGAFDPEAFRTKAAHDQVKAINIKLSQGAKPGLGGHLPADKITPEIAEARGVPMGVDCVSPAAHTAFDTPTGLLEFVARLRKLSGGKPVGFKLCVGLRTDVLAICKAIVATGILPDFIVVDGAEGGTGAAPLEYEDHMGAPLTEGLHTVHEALVGIGVREHVKIGAAGKIATGFEMVRRLVQQADYCLAARPMMMAAGCIQSQKCHTNRCPTGVATQDKRLAAGLDPEKKAESVYNFHKATVAEATQIISTLGVDSPSQLSPDMLFKHVTQTDTLSYAQVMEWMDSGVLLEAPPADWQADWNAASADHFGPAARVT